jgi:hypothetical protein
MPGFELIGEEERKEVTDVLNTGVFMRYGDSATFLTFFLPSGEAARELAAARVDGCFYMRSVLR